MDMWWLTQRSGFVTYSCFKDCAFKPEFFSGFLFATAEVAFITAMIYFHIIHNFNNKKVGTSKVTHNSV